MAGAPHLTEKDIDKAVALLAGWTGKLTWDLYLRTLATELEHGHVYSKVAMLKHDRIKSKWQEAHKRLRDEAEDVGEKSYGTTAVGVLRRKLDQALKGKAEAEQRERDLLEQFERWQFNAERAGLKLSQLDAPLPTPQKALKKKPEKRRR